MRSPKKDGTNVVSSFVVAVVVVVVVATTDVAALVITVGALGAAITFGIDVVGETTMTLCSCQSIYFSILLFIFIEIRSIDK